MMWDKELIRENKHYVIVAASEEISVRQLPPVWWLSEVIVVHLLERRAGPKVFHFP